MSSTSGAGDMNVFSTILIFALAILLGVCNRKRDREHRARQKAYFESVERTKRWREQDKRSREMVRPIFQEPPTVPQGAPAFIVSSGGVGLETDLPEASLKERYRKIGGGNLYVEFSDVPPAVRSGWHCRPDARIKVTIRRIPGERTAIAEVVEQVEVPSDYMPPMWMEAHYGPFWDRGAYDEYCHYYPVTDEKWLDSLK